MFLPLKVMLSRIVTEGDITFVDWRGREYRFGNGTGDPVRVRLTDRAIERALVRDPELAAGEGYMDGQIVFELGTAYDFIALMMANMARQPLPAWTQTFSKWRQRTRRLAAFNPIPRALRNVEHHYDIEPSIYELFLDPDRQYSCAYFLPNSTLDAAQHAKKRHIAAKLALKPGQRVLDIGSGWGGLALYLAQAANANVKGITLSSEQLTLARERAAKAGLSKAVTFDLRDYREVDGTFDRVVSVGMFEHVGYAHYEAYFKTLHRVLADDGVALLHTIGRADAPAATNPFIAKYIFPGGALPSLSEIMIAVEQSGLIVTDVEVLRLHYAKTLREWRTRFLNRRAEAVAIAGERFARMWEFYLAGAEAAFRYQNLVVFQVQLAKNVDTLPIVRDYMAAAERRLALAERGDPEGPRLAS